MEILIPVEMARGEFIDYIVEYAHDMLDLSFDNGELLRISNALNIDSRNAILDGIDELEFYTGNRYVHLTPSKSLKYKGISYDQLFRYINYGIIGLRGYTIIEQVFDYITENILVLYIKWSSD